MSLSEFFFKTAPTKYSLLRLLLVDPISTILLKTNQSRLTCAGKDVRYIGSSFCVLVQVKTYHPVYLSSGLSTLAFSIIFLNDSNFYEFVLGDYHLFEYIL